MKRFVFTGALALAMAACTTNPAQRDAARLALYEAHAGEAVSSFRYYGGLSGWTPLGENDVALWTRPNQAYLVSFNGRCPDLEFGSAITVSGHFNTVYAKFDKVTVLVRGGMSMPCFIREIRPLDVKAIRNAEREMRTDARTAERAAD